MSQRAQPIHRAAPYLIPLVLPIAALVAILPLLRNGPTCGHDFDFHILSWFEAAREFAHGNPHPRWATLPAFGAGEPRFVFYPPVSWTLGGLLTLAFTHLPHVAPAAGFNAVPILFTWIALAAAGLALYRLAHRYVPPNPALVAATLYVANPYLLFTAYERTAFAELLAASILPFLIAAILPVADAAERPSIPRIAIPVALLWLTNAPAAVMGSYTFALIVLLRVVALRRTPHAARSLIVRSVAGTLLGLCLAGFYLVPAIYEQRWVEIAMAVIPGMRPVDNTLFHQTSDPDHDAVLRTASYIAATLLATTAGLLSIAFNRSSRGSQKAPIPTLAALSLTVAFLLTPVSLPLWRHLPELAFLQFPWRLLAILAIVAAVAAALALHRLRRLNAVIGGAAVLLSAALAVSTGTHFFQACDTGESPREALAGLPFTYTVLPTDEYTPQPADNDALRHNNPPFRLSPDPDSPAPETTKPGVAPTHLDLAVTEPTFLILNLRDYPAWQATLNGAPAPHGPARDDGLLTFNLPAGRDHLDLAYLHTPDETAGTLLSAFALLTLVALHLRRSRST